MVENKAKNGIFTYQLLKEAIDRGEITCPGNSPIDERQIQPASVDLRLGKKVYRLISSFLPENGQKVLDRLQDPTLYNETMVMYEHDLDEQGMVLEKNGVYLIPLMEGLKLPRSVKGRINPKSTTGRLDIFARVITDGSPRFDDIKQGYSGQLFIEVVPRSFTIRVKPGLSLVQLRLMTGDYLVTDDDLQSTHKDTGLLFEENNTPSPSQIDSISVSNGLFMSVDLRGTGKSTDIIGYKSKKNSHVVDLSLINNYNVDDFWEAITVNSNSKGTLILEPEEFYILSSKEKIRIPPMYAAEMAPYEAGSGELRTHYAGFFDPGFGFGNNGEIKGTKAVLEVRAHDVPFMIAHGQTFCKLSFEKMAEMPEKVYGPAIGSSYQYQSITLSKQFKSL